ncbi:COG3039: Transposase and inactivated derivatives, IS5 family [Richelia intracellularis]|nr:COG3039: Transposase and inactivated derivatives, IS5 family [Richelia intracellularis]
MGISDRQTVEQIKDNPYLHYFIGMSYYINEAPFDASTLVHFRERISANVVNKVNQMMEKKYKRRPLRKQTKKRNTKGFRIKK